MGSQNFQVRALRNLLSLLAFLCAFHTRVQAGGLAEKEPFEDLYGISALNGNSKMELSSQVVHEGKTSLKWSAVVNPQDALLVKQFPHPVDLSAFNALTFWVYPDVPDNLDSFSLEVRMVVWNDEKASADWHTVGQISNFTAPNRKWSRHCFYIAQVQRKKVLRHFDIIAWHFNYRQNQTLTFYLDDLVFETLPLERSGLVFNGGFEKEIIPWRVGGIWREGEAKLDKSTFMDGNSSLYLSAPPNKPSRTVEQSVNVIGGMWYRLNLWLRTEDAAGEGAQVVLEWQSEEPQDPKKPVLKTYVGGLQQLAAQLRGTHRFTFISRLAKAPSKAQKCKLILRLNNGGKAWFDSISLYEANGEVKPIAHILGMPAKRTLLWKEKVHLPTSLKFKPIKTAFRIALVPYEGKNFTLSLVYSEGKRQPLLRFDGERESVSVRDSVPGVPFKTVWEALGGSFIPGPSSLVLYVEPNIKTTKSAKTFFALNSCGINLPWWGPFELPDAPGEVIGLELSGEGSVNRLLVEAPLWTVYETERRQSKVKRLQLEMVDGVGWMAKDVPEDLTVSQPPPTSPWTEQAVILHTGVNFKLLIENLERIKAMGFNTICLRPPHPSGRIGFGSDCCVQDYFSINPEKGNSSLLKQLVDKAHRRGIRVILWLVPNHTASSNPLLYQHPELYYFDDGSFRSGWYDVVDLDYTNPQTWRFMAEVGKHWVRRFNLDGFGIDVPDLLPRNFFSYFKWQLLKAKGGDIFILMETSFSGVERWGGDARYGFLSAYQMKEIFEGWVPPPKPPQKVISELIKRLYPNESWEAFGPFGGNWGLTGCINRYGAELTKCAAVVMATLPFVPEVCVGSEILEEHHEDNPYGFVAKVLNLRQKHPSFRSTQVEMVSHDKEEQACVYLKRSTTEMALVLINFSNQAAKITLKLPSDADEIFRKTKHEDCLTGKPVQVQWQADGSTTIELPSRRPIVLMGLKQ